MTHPTPSESPDSLVPTFTRAEQHALNALRARYRQDRDLFANQELDRLRFLRWLYRTGRLVP